MIISATKTELFYSLVEQPNHVQQRALKLIQQCSPERHQQVQALLVAERQHQITELLGQEAIKTSYQTEQLSGSFIDKYRLDSLLGQGGFGQVYLAYRDNQTFEQKVAIKVFEPWISNILSQTPMGSKPFQEAHLLAQLNHPNIAKVYDGGFEKLNNCHATYIVLEYIEGATLDNYINDNKLSNLNSG